MEIRASCPIPAGSEICIQYVRPNSGTLVRRAILSKKWFFDCACARCADPAECGSRLSGIVCPSPRCGEAALPERPLDARTDWLCAGCGRRVAHRAVGDMLVDATNAMEQEDEEEDTVAKYEKWIYDHAKILLPSHYLMIEVSYLAIE